MNILIAIHGSHSQPEAMQAQRETWLKYRTFEGYDDDGWRVDYKLFLGAPAKPWFAAAPKDIVYGDFPDGPIWQRKVGGARTEVQLRKTEALARYALDNGYDFVFKCDDDTYVRSEQLLASGFEDHDYSGFASKHFAFGFGWYRWAQGGAGYWLSRRAMEVIVEHGLHLVPAEDFAVGQLLARNGIHPHHDERYRPGVTLSELENPSASWITLHKVNPAWMRRLHAHFDQ